MSVHNNHTCESLRDRVDKQRTNLQQTLQRLRHQVQTIKELNSSLLTQQKNIRTVTQNASKRLQEQETELKNFVTQVRNVNYLVLLRSHETSNVWFFLIYPTAQLYVSQVLLDKFYCCGNSRSLPQLLVAGPLTGEAPSLKATGISFKRHTKIFIPVHA